MQEDQQEETKHTEMQKPTKIKSPGAAEVLEHGNDTFKQSLLSEEYLQEFNDNNPTTIHPTPNDSLEKIQRKLNTLRMMKQYALEN
jgi:ribosomal protein L16 Arg81 hydroxylase